MWKFGRNLIEIYSEIGEQNFKFWNVIDGFCKWRTPDVPFVKYPAIVKLESRHGVNLGPAYRTPDSAKVFTSCIAESFHQGFLDKLSSSEDHKFFSFLIDGNTDVGNQEDQLIVLVYCDKIEVTSEIFYLYMLFFSSYSS